MFGILIMKVQQRVALNVIESALQALLPVEAKEVVDALTKSQCTQFELERLSANSTILQPVRLSRIESDSELEQFLLSMKGQHTHAAMLQQCIDKFGKERAPSKSALNRFIKKTKRRWNGE